MDKCQCGVPLEVEGATRCPVCKGLHEVAKRKAKAKAKSKVKKPSIPENVEIVVEDIVGMLKELGEGGQADVNMAIKELYREFSFLYVPEGPGVVVKDPAVEGTVKGSKAIYTMDR